MVMVLGLKKVVLSEFAVVLMMGLLVLVGGGVKNCGGLCECGVDGNANDGVSRDGGDEYSGVDIC